MDNVREDFEERHRPIQLSTAYRETKNREVWRNNISYIYYIKGLIVSKLMEEKKEEEKKITNDAECSEEIRKSIAKM